MTNWSSLPVHPEQDPIPNSTARGTWRPRYTAQTQTPDTEKRILLDSEARTPT